MADTGGKKRDNKRGYRVGFWAVSIVVLAIILLVPIAVLDLFEDVVKPSEDHVYPVAAAMPPATTYNRLHLVEAGCQVALP